MSALVTKPIGRLVCGSTREGLSVLLRPKNVSARILSATIVSKAARPDLKRPGPPPFPYKEKRYTLLHYIWDRATYRFNENSKIIVVDGPIAVGKSALAKQMAEDLDMHYLKEVRLADYYVNAYNQSYRDELNHKLPVSCQMFDETDFCRNPKHQNAPSFQLDMLQHRALQYSEALAHLLNTGQGVVLERSVYSDFVFADAMFKCGLLSPSAKQIYERIKSNLYDLLVTPHLVIYLDIPVDVVLKRVKERAHPWEVNSPIMNEKYLTAMEDSYKHRFLKQIKNFSEVLVYDWTNYGDPDVVVEDIERIDFDHYGLEDTRLGHWREMQEKDLLVLRKLVTNDPATNVVAECNECIIPCPELLTPSEDLLAKEDVFYNTPGWKYAAGYNPDKGDNVWFK